MCFLGTLLLETACLPALDRTEWLRLETLGWHETFTGLQQHCSHCRAHMMIYDEPSHGSPGSTGFIWYIEDQMKSYLIFLCGEDFTIYLQSSWPGDIYL